MQQPISGVGCSSFQRGCAHALARALMHVWVHACVCVCIRVCARAGVEVEFTRVLVRNKPRAVRLTLLPRGTVTWDVCEPDTLTG